VPHQHLVQAGGFALELLLGFDGLHAWSGWRVISTRAKGLGYEAVQFSDAAARNFDAQRADGSAAGLASQRAPGWSVAAREGHRAYVDIETPAILRVRSARAAAPHGSWSRGTGEKRPPIHEKARNAPSLLPLTDGAIARLQPAEPEDGIGSRRLCQIAQMTVERIRFRVTPAYPSPGCAGRPRSARRRREEGEAERLLDTLRKESRSCGRGIGLRRCRLLIVQGGDRHGRGPGVGHASSK